MKRNLKWLLVAVLSLPTPLPSYSWAQRCGGTDRWAVKVGTDPSASSIDLTAQTPIGLQDLINLPESQLPGDNSTRLDAETHLYVVRTRLVEFKFETDNDYHITDDTLNFTPARSTASGHSFVAEIPDANCIAGKHGNPSVQSAFIAGIQNARGELEAQFQNIDKSGAFNDAGGIPVQIVGIGFFDRPHGQVGRAPNNIEIHPVLDITFNPAPGTLTLTASPATLAVPQGGSANITISTVAGGGLNSAIALATSTPPTGATATFSPTSIAAPGSGTSMLTIAVGSTTPLGNSTLSVSGSGGGVSGSTTVNITVTPQLLPPQLLSSLRQMVHPFRAP